MGEEFMPGMKVSWIVTDHKESPMQVEPYLSGAKFEKRPDWEYYARRVAQTLAYVTEVYGWDGKALLTGKRSQQKSLSSDDFSEALPAESPRRADKKLTLADFFWGGGCRPQMRWSVSAAEKDPVQSPTRTAV